MLRLLLSLLLVPALTYASAAPSGPAMPAESLSKDLWPLREAEKQEFLTVLGKINNCHHLELLSVYLEGELAQMRRRLGYQGTPPVSYTATLIVGLFDHPTLTPVVVAPYISRHWPTESSSNISKAVDRHRFALEAVNQALRACRQAAAGSATTAAK